MLNNCIVLDLGSKPVTSETHRRKKQNTLLKEKRFPFNKTIYIYMS